MLDRMASYSPWMIFMTIKDHLPEFLPPVLQVLGHTIQQYSHDNIGHLWYKRVARRTKWTKSNAIQMYELHQEPPGTSSHLSWLQRLEGWTQARNPNKQCTWNKVLKKQSSTTPPSYRPEWFLWPSKTIFLTSFLHVTLQYVIVFNIYSNHS